jgi:hypothetical protein
MKFFFWQSVSKKDEGILSNPRLGLNFINVLRAAFAPVDPKSVKRYWHRDWILTLLGATGVKAVRKNVGEIEPGSQLTLELDRAFFLFLAYPFAFSSLFILDVAT